MEALPKRNCNISAVERHHEVQRWQMINFLLQDIPESVNDGLWITGLTEEFSTRGTNTEIQKYSNSEKHKHKYINSNTQVKQRSSTRGARRANEASTVFTLSLSPLTDVNRHLKHWAAVKWSLNQSSKESCLNSFREGFTKKAALLLDFAQMKGVRGRGRPCPNFLSPFHNCIFGQ